MCRVLGVSASGYYAWQRPRRRVPGAGRTTALLEQIRAIHRQSRGTYGAPRIHAELRGRRRARGPQARRALADAGGLARREPAQVAGDDRARGRTPGRRPIWCSASLRRPARISCGSPTSPTSRRRRAFCTWRSCSTSGVAGSSAGRWRRTCAPSWSLAALDMAVAQRRPTGGDPSLRSGLPVHGDRLRPALPRGRRAAVDGLGRRLLRQRDVRELLRHPRMRAARSRALRTPAEARAAVFDFIEGWYNPTRRHSALDYLSPIDFERQAPHAVATRPAARTPRGRARPVEAAGPVDPHRTRGPQGLGKRSAFPTAPTGPLSGHD